MPRPLISIVTISFNQKQFLRQTIESVISQKTSDTEYVIVDAGSTDGSVELIKSFGSKIDTFVSEPDKGPADGLNKGFAVTKGSVGYFLNSDDFLLPNAIRIMQDFWIGNPDTDALLCNGWMVDHNGQPLRELRAGAATLDKLFNSAGRMFQQGMSFRLDALHRCGGFNIDNRTCWDFELLCALLASGKPAQSLAQRVGAFRLHGGSLTGGAAGQRHQARYHADKLRIVESYLGSTAGNSRWSRFINDPIWYINRLLDMQNSQRMISRFSADHSPL